MSRLLVIVCTLALTVALASGEHSAAQDAPACDDRKFLPAQIRCHLDTAERASSADACLTAEDAAVRVNCISLFAERSAAPGACGLIRSDDPTGAMLQNACVAGVAVATRNAEICDQVDQPELADTCFVQLVLEHDGDVSLCQRVEDPHLRDACFGEPPQ